MEHPIFQRARRLGIAVLLLATLLATASAPSSSAQAGWTCTPIDPALPVPTNPCFRAVLSDTNLVTLEWQVANSAALVYISDDLGHVFQDVGFQVADCTPGAAIGCKSEIRITEGGTQRWKLAVSNAAWNRVTVPASVPVTGPAAPTTTGGGHVDVLNPTAKTFTFAHAGTVGMADQWVEVVPPGFLAPPVRQPALSGTFTISADKLTDPGEVRYGVRYCAKPTLTGAALCSAANNVGYVTGPARFVGPHRVRVASGSNLTLNVTTDSGGLRLVSSDTLVPANPSFGGLPLATVTGTSHTIPTSLLTPGHHSIELISCDAALTRCSNRADAARATAAGTFAKAPTTLAVADHYEKGSTIATVTTPGGAVQTIKAPASGKVYFQVTNGQQVAANALVAFVITPSKDVLTVEVGSPVSWTENRDWTLDFASGSATDALAGGQALDVDYDAANNIWETMEFSASLERRSPAGAVESFTIPLLRKPVPGTGVYAPVAPFGPPFGPTGGAASIPALAERVVAHDGKIWTTQGGALLPSSTIPNHSRIISFDPAGTDLPATEWDERLCAVNVPGNDNEVIGLTAAGGRIWFGEFRQLNGTSRISSFVPSPALCGNMLDFNDPDAVAASTTTYCTTGQTPEANGCVATMLLPAGVAVSHLDADPADGSLWFADPRGTVLGHVVNPVTNPTVVTHALPTPVAKLDGSWVHAAFRSFPWTLRVHGGAVYLSEYLDNDIVRFDKATSTFDEIHVPYLNNQVRLHSIDIDAATNRLWFTLANETWAPEVPTAGGIGYIDLADWTSHLANPTANPTTSAVTYTGLSSLNTSGPNSIRHQAFRGIAVNQTNGKIALATMFREQITELVPKTTFRP